MAAYEEAATKAAYDPRMMAKRTGGIDQASLRAVELPLDELQKHLTEARQRVLDAASTLQGIADTILGGQPEDPRTGGVPTAAPRPGKVGSLLDEVMYCHNAISMLNHQIDRFRPLSG